MTNPKNLVEIVTNKSEIKRRMRVVSRTLLAGLLAAGTVLLLSESYQSSARRAYEAYYNFIGNYPDEADTGWSDVAQGLTHDRDNWFITQRERLWKIPVTHDLNNVSCGGGVVCRSLDDIRGLSAEGYNHLGDPEYYEFRGKGYVLVPVEAPLEGDTRLAPSVVAAFDADTLEYIAHSPLPWQRDAPWVAVDPQGNVYSSNFDGVTAVNKFGLDWSSLS